MLRRRFRPDKEDDFNDYINMVIENIHTMTPEQRERELCVFALTLLAYKVPAKTLVANSHQ